MNFYSTPTGTGITYEFRVWTVRRSRDMLCIGTYLVNEQ